MRPLQILQLGQEMAEMFGMPPFAPAALHPAVARTAQCRLGEDVVHGRIPGVAQRGRIGADAGGNQRGIFGGEQFPCVRLQQFQRGLRASLAFLGAVAKSN